MVARSSNGGDATPRPVAQTPSGAGAAATPATAPRGSVDGALPLRIAFRAEKTGKSPKVPGKADGTRGKGNGVVNAVTAASALGSTQENTVRVAAALQRLAVQESARGGARPRWRRRARTLLLPPTACNREVRLSHVCSQGSRVSADAAAV
jgi:hypothetical protein